MHEQIHAFLYHFNSKLNPSLDFSR